MKKSFPKPFKNAIIYKDKKLYACLANKPIVDGHVVVVWNKVVKDLNLLGLAEVNIKHFEQAFPQEKKIDEAKNCLKQMHEIYAHGLYDIGKFFERTGKPEAAMIYYSKIIDNFPLASYAELSKERLVVLKK